MIRTSVIRMKECGNRRLKKNWQVMNRFVQMVLLKINSSHLKNVKMEFIQMIQII